MVPDDAVHAVGVTRAIITTDADGGIVGWDAGAEVLFGHRAADVLGSPVDIIIPEHLREAHWAGFHRAMRSPVVRDMAADLPVLCADGNIWPFAGRLLVLSDALGNAIGAMAIYTDAGSTGVRPFG